MATPEQCEAKLHELGATVAELRRVAEAREITVMNAGESEADVPTRTIRETVAFYVSRNILDKLSSRLGLPSTAEQERQLLETNNALTAEALRIAKEADERSKAANATSKAANRKSTLGIVLGGLAAIGVAINGLLGFLNNAFGVWDWFHGKK